MTGIFANYVCKNPCLKRLKMKPGNGSNSQPNCSFKTQEGTFVKWGDLDLSQKQRLTEALININHLNKHMFTATQLDNLATTLISKIINNLEASGLEPEFVDKLKKCKNFSDVKELDFTRYLQEPIDELKRDIESEGRGSFMPNLLRQIK